MKKNENKNLITVIVITFLVLIIWSSLVYLTFNQVTDIAAKTNDLKILNEEQAKSAVLRSLVLKTKNERGVLNDYFYNKDSALKLIEFIEKMADDTGIDLKFSDIKTEDKLVASLEIEGSLKNIKEFLSRIEVAPFLSQFEKIALQEKRIIDEDGNQTLSWIGNISIIVLSFNSKN